MSIGAPGPDDNAGLGVDASTMSLGRRAARGAAVLGARSLLLQIVQVASAVVTARLITAETYGSFAIAMTIVASVRYVGDLGVGQSFIPRPVITPRQLQAGAFIALATAGIGAALICVSAAQLSAWLHGTHETILVTQLLAACLIIDALRFAPTVRLMRSLSFSAVGVVSIVESAVAYAVQIGGLLLGYGVWAMVAAQLARSIVGTTAIARLGGGITTGRPRRGSTALIRTGLPFQTTAALGGAMGLLLPVAVAIELHARGVGFWAWSTILAAPVLAVVVVSQTVALPTLSRLRERSPHEVETASELLLRLTVLFSAGAAAILYVFADRIVPLIFGPHWIPAIGAVKALLIGLVPLTAVFIVSAILESAMRAKLRALSAALGNVAALATVVPLAHIWGVTGAAVATGIVGPVADAVILIAVTRVRIRRAMRNCALIAIGCYAVARPLSSGASDIFTLVALLALASVGGMIVGVLVDRGAVRYLVRNLSRARVGT